MAMDGTADININTSAIDKDVVVNTITNNDISGLVSITDKQQGKVTEYMNGQTRTYKIGEIAGAWQANNNSNYTYEVADGLQYQWIGGVSGEVKKKYQYSEDFLFWGLLDYGKTEEFIKDVSGKVGNIQDLVTSTSGGNGEKDNKGNGVIITTGGTGKDFVITGSYTTTNKGQAMSFANKVVKRQKEGKRTVSIYEIDENKAFESCSLLWFEKPDEKWLDFVSDN